MAVKCNTVSSELQTRAHQPAVTIVAASFLKCVQTNSVDKLVLLIFLSCLAVTQLRAIHRSMGVFGENILV